MQKSQKIKWAFLMISVVVLLVVAKFADNLFGEENPGEELMTETGSQGESETETSSRAADTGWTVVLDAGHGAADSGKVGINGVLEKDVNLSIVLKLREYLEQEGVMVVLTRVDDSPLYQESDQNHKLADMKKRLDIMDSANPNLVVSIHQNSYTQESAKGPQVFYYATSEEGQKLAQYLQDSFDSVVGEEQNKRVIKPNRDYYLLVHTPYTIVICECGFLSNQQEADLLATEDYQDKVAKSVSEGIMNYLRGEVQ